MAKKHIDRAALIATIRELKELSNEQKSDILQLISEQKTYGIVWEDSPEDVEENLRVNVPVLVEDKDKAIISNADDAPNHILIEGDNLEALTALSYTHEGKIDVIYIDPPYNTGNKDFVYNDSFVDSEDGYRHSKWLSFMEKRLKIAKKLLSDKGVIFISIDDNEQANLKLLCDEIFRESNCIGPFIQNKMNAKNDTINIQKNHEYILCYRKQATFSNSNMTKVIPNIIVEQNVIKEVFQEGNEFYYLNDSITTRGEGGTLKARPNLGYSFYYNPETKELVPWADYDVEIAKTSDREDEVYTDDQNLISSGFVIIRPPLVRGKLGCWTWDINKAKRDIKYLYVKESKNRFNVHKRTFVSAEFVKEEKGRYYYVERVKSNSRSILDYSTNEGTNAFKSILGDNVDFNNPKNVEMLKYLISTSSKDGSVILDFFAGSGTTLHATMQLNAEDGGHRQCILCTNNENNICEEVTYERNKRVINGYTTPKGVEVEGLHDNSLRYYKIEDVPRDSSTTGLKKLMLASTDLLCIKNDLYEEQSVFGNIKLRKNIARYFDDGKQKMLIIYKVDAIESIVEEIKKMPADTFIKVYVFSTNNYAMDADFEKVSDKVFLCALPAAIYNAYRKVLPRKNNVITEEEEV